MRRSYLISSASYFAKTKREYVLGPVNYPQNQPTITKPNCDESRIIAILALPRAFASSSGCERYILLMSLDLLAEYTW